MGYSLVKYLDSVDYKRALFYLDRGESDLPKVDPNTFGMGSRAISQSTGQEWFLDTNFEWKPVRDCPGSKTYERNKYGGNEFEIVPIVQDIKVTPKKLTMNKNSSAQLFAETLGDDILDKRIHWEILSTIKNGTYITQDGYLHVGNYNKPTILTVRATSLVDDQFYKDIPVQVDPYGELIGEVYGIAISPNQPVIGAGQVLQLVGTVCGNGSYNKEVTWSISASSDSVIDEDGKLTIGENETYPVIIVTAKSVFDEKITASMPIVVKKGENIPTIDKVTIVPKTLTIGPECFASLATVVDGKGEYIPDVKWSVIASSEDTIITKNGMLAIGEDELEGEITVRASSVIDPDKFDEITVIISNSVLPSDKKVLEVIVEPNSLSVYKSYNAIFSAKVVGINIYDQRVTWSTERNSSDYTRIKPTGSFTVASEEDASSVIIKATSVLDPFAFGLAAVEILNMKDSGTGLSSQYISNIVIEENKDLVVYFGDGTSKVVGKIFNGVYIPHITEENKILSFTYDAEPGAVPAPVDLSVDLSDYALKSQILTDVALIAAQDVGGVEKDRYYPVATEVRQIVKDMLGQRAPTGEVLLYRGATDDVPTDYLGFDKIEGRTKEDLLNNKLIVSIPVRVDPITEQGQYPVLAVQNNLRLVKWNQSSAPDFPTNSFNTVDKGEYSLYYLTQKVTKTIEYLFTFEEV